MLRGTVAPNLCLLTRQSAHKARTSPKHTYYNQYQDSCHLAILNLLPDGRVCVERSRPRVRSGRRGAPEAATFVDGGIMSNFPVDLFHQPDKVPPPSG